MEKILKLIFLVQIAMHIYNEEVNRISGLIIRNS